MEVVLVAHGTSRRTRAELPRVTAALAARGVSVRGLHVVASSKELRRCVKAAAKAGADAVVVAGGDGAMTHAVDVMAHREVPMGVIPLGTGNSFAQSLGIAPDDLDAAVAVIAGGRVVEVDLGLVDGTHFANFATVGLSTAIAGATPRLLKNVAGKIAYALAAVVPLLRARSFRATLRYDDGRLELQTEDIVIASGRYFGSQPVAPDASIVDGRLAVFTARETSAFAALRTYLAFGAGRTAALPDVHVFATRELRVRTARPQPIALDGSPFGETPARFSVAARALRVFVPQSFDDAR